MQLAVATGLMGVVCLLTLSDSIIGPLGDTISAGFQLVRGVESGVGFDVLSRPSLPVASDTLGHFLAWTAVGFTAGGLAVTAASKFNLFIGLFAFSALLEVGQRHLSWSRSAEFTDLMANGTGLALGFLAYSVAQGMVSFAFPTLGSRADALVRRAVPWA